MRSRDLGDPYSSCMFVKKTVNAAKTSSPIEALTLHEMPV